MAILINFFDNVILQAISEEAKVKLELTYIMIENDGEEIIAIDKLNGVYRVQGEDMLADVTALI